MTKPFSLDQGTSRANAGVRAGLASLLIASFLMGSTAARADVFGGGAAAATQGAQPGSVVDRVAALEAQLKELREKGGIPTAAQPSPAVRPNLNVPPPLPGLEGLPERGADEREQIIVQKELTYEVLGTVNDDVYVRDGDRRMVLSQKDFKAFEKAKRQKVVQKLKVDAVGTSGGLNFPELQPPPDVSASTTGAAQSAPPAPAPAPAAAHPANTTSTPPTKPVSPTPGQAKPASPVKKN